MPVGGGGLISGIGAYLKAISPRTRIVGVEPVDADAMSRSLKKKRRVRLEQVGLFADGVAVKRVGEETFRLCRRLVDEMVLVATHPWDVDGAVRAGLDAVWVDRHEGYYPRTFSAPTHTVNGIDGLLDVLS